MKDMTVPAALRRALAARSLDSHLFARAEPGDLPPETGAYLLLLGLSRETAVIRTKNRRIFAPGWYVYAGNAYGPGGLAARIGRHFRRGKPRHWHIDSLTDAADLFAVTIPGGTECNLIARLRSEPGFGVPVPGFGSSDCRTCESHLLGWQGAYQPGSIP